MVFNWSNVNILVISVTIPQTQNVLVQVQCPSCGKKESILITVAELNDACTQHSLITKAISHSTDGHVLTIYIDGQGIVRRKYCFDIAKNDMKLSKRSLSTDLSSIFCQMFEDSTR